MAVNNTRVTPFSRRRGRPRNDHPQIDTGTPETVMKRLLGLTTEVLDLCLERNLINHKQHWCGMHLRWLHTIRHGIPSVRAIELAHISEHEQKPAEYDDPLWRAAREKEYNQAITAITQSGHAISLINLCIYNERPKFLGLLPNSTYKNTERAAENIAELQNGLDILGTLWKPH